MRRSASALSFAGLLLGLASLVAVSCGPCPNCNPVMTCTQSSCGSAGATTTTVTTSTSTSGCGEAEPVALVSTARPCTHDSDCSTGGPGTGFACTMVTGDCETQSGFCKVRLRDADAQCAEGTKRMCKTLNDKRGVIFCDITRCSWPNPGDTSGGCVACGGKNEACCVGGCDPPYSCTDVANGPGARCQCPPGSLDPRCTPPS